MKLTSKTEGKCGKLGELVGKMSLVEMVSVKELVVAQKVINPPEHAPGALNLVNRCSKTVR